MPHFNFEQGEPGTVVLQVRQSRDRPSVDWSGDSISLVVYDYGSNEILGISAGATVENEEASDLGGWDFDLVGIMPTDLAPGYHRGAFRVTSGAATVAVLPHRYGQLTVRVWETGEEEAEMTGSATYAQAGHGLTVGDWVYRTGGGAWAKAQANAEATLARGLVVATTASGVTIFFGGVLAYAAHGMGSIGETLYLSAATAGGESTSPPAPGNWQQILGSVVTADQIIVEIGSGVAV